MRTLVYIGLRMRQPPQKSGPYRRRCTFASLMRELVARGKATPETAERIAREWLEAIGWGTVTVTKGSTIEWVVEYNPTHAEVRSKRG